MGHRTGRRIKQPKCNRSAQAESARFFRYTRVYRQFTRDKYIPEDCTIVKHDPVRAHILQQVYEDNLGIHPVRRRRASSRSTPSEAALLATRSLRQRLDLLLMLSSLLLVLLPRPLQPDADQSGIGQSMMRAVAYREARGGVSGYSPGHLLALFGRGFDHGMAWQRWVMHWPGSHIAEGSAVAGVNQAAPSWMGINEMLDSSDASLSRLLGLGVNTIVIDPGHGGRDAGASGAGGLLEKDVTLSIALALRERLSQQPNLYVLLTRDSDSSVSLRDRVSFANLHGADLFISIHVNALAQESLPFVETFYLGADDAASIDRDQLALENRYSGYSIGEFRQLLDQLGDQFHHHESRRLADAIQQSLFGNLRRHNPELLSGGLKTAPLVVLLGAEMPAVLAEITSLSNRAEEARLGTSAYRQLIVDYLEQGIVEYLSDVRLDKEGAEQYASKEDHRSRQ